MAKPSGLSQSAVVRLWRAFGLQAHRAETFKLLTDPPFIEKVRDVVELYLNPPDRALVLCVDEKSHIQALDRPKPTLPMMPRNPRFHVHFTPTPASWLSTLVLQSALLNLEHSL